MSLILETQTNQETRLIMKNTKSILHLALGLGALALTSLAATSTSRAQANLSFSGGLGTPLTITLNQSVNYRITTAATAGNAPTFNFQNLGNILTFDNSGTGTLAYSLNLGPAQFLNFSRTGYASNDTTAADGFFLDTASVPALAVGDLVTLLAGSLKTSYNFTGAPPAAGSFNTFVINTVGARLSAANGTAVVPEPSTYAMLLAGAGLTGLMVRRRARLA